MGELKTRPERMAGTGQSPADVIAALHLSSFLSELRDGGCVTWPGSQPWSRADVTHYLANLDETLHRRLGVGALVVSEPPTTIPAILDIIWFLSTGRPVEVNFLDVPRWVPHAERHSAAMRFSLSFFANDEDGLVGPKYRLLLDSARLADEHGLTAIWTPERHFHAFGGLYPSPAVTSAALAAITDRISIRAGSVVLPLHDPITVAEEWAVVDNISHGRVGLSFASGWHANDFVLAPDQYAHRKQVMLDRIDIVRRLWRGEPVRRRTGAGDESDVFIRPRPIQPELPFWLTAAGSPDTFRLAGELGGFVLTNLMGQTLDDLAGKIEIYREAWRNAGHSPAGGHVTLMLHTFLAESEERAYAAARDPLLRYFRSSIDIARGFAASQGIDVRPEDLSEADISALLEHGLDRYVRDGGLFGTPDSTAALVQRLRRIGVDEVAALVDFGVPVEDTLRGIALLGEVCRREQVRARAAAEAAVHHTEADVATLARRLRTHDTAALQGSHDLFAWLAEIDPGASEDVVRLGQDLVRHTLPDGSWITAWAHHDPDLLVAQPAVDVDVVDAQGRPLGVGVVGDLVVAGSKPTGQRARWRPDGRLDLLPPRPPRPRPPLSFSQQRLWSLDHLIPHNIAYNNPLALRMRGRLDVTALHRALREVVRRHEILRTTFPATADGPQQVIHPVLNLELPVVDAESADITRLAIEHARRPFDLTQGPLLRVCLLRLPSDVEHILLICMHHIVSDGWSAGVLFAELGALYAAFTAGEPSPLPPLPMQYAEYAVWQREHSEAFERERDYWRDALAGVPVLRLPLDRPRGPIQGHDGARSPVAIGRELTDGVQALCRRAGATPFMVLLTAFVTVLHRYSGQTDLAIGTSVAGRHRAETEPLVGVFVNSVVVRTDAGGDPSFWDLLARVKSTALGAFAHQEIPFERMVDELRVPRDLSLTPLFQTILVLHNTPSPRMELGELTLEGLDVDPGVAKLDLMLELREGPDGISGSWEYNTELFDATTMAQLTRHLCAVLADAVSSPDRRLSQLALLSDADRAELLALSTGEPLVTTAPALTVPEAFEAQAARTPSVVAVGELTYADLNAWANRLAHGLRQRGVRPGVRVALLFERVDAAIVAMLGVLKAGGAYVPLDPRAPAARRAALLQLADVIAILDDHAVREFAAGQPAEPPRPLAAAADAAYVIFTSGSTGQPKGVVVEHRQLLYSTWARLATYGESAGTCVMSYPLHFDASVGWIYYTLLTGGTLHCPQSQVALDPRELAELVRRVGARRFASVPALYGQLLTTADLGQLASLRTVSVIGERCAPAVARAHCEALPQATLFNEYGPTETTVWSTVYRVTAPVTGEVSIGRPLPSTLALVLDSRQQLLPIGAPGELYLGGPGVARGYLNSPELTDRRFVTNHITGAGRLYRTGDVVRWNRDGVLEFIGRIDRQVKVRGFRVEPAEIEATLTAHPEIAEAVVVPIGGQGTVRLVGYVAATAGSIVDVEAVRAFARTRLPDHLVPATFVSLPALPRNSSGKIDIAALPQPTLARTDAPTEPRTELERTLAMLVADVVGQAEVGVHDNFFDIGGDSLLAIIVVTQAREHGVELTAREIFQHPTVAGLAALARDAVLARSDPPSEAITGPVPVSPPQRQFFERNIPAPHHWNGGFQLELTEPAEAETLQRAFRAVLHHHDALRLRFTRDEDGWCQQVSPSADDWTLWRIDLSAIERERQTAELLAQAGRMHASLDLAQGPLIRAAWVQFGPGQPERLVISAHHLVIDGHSWRIILDDLFTAYRQLAAGAEPALPRKTTSYLEWASRLPEFAASERGQAELAYWTALPYGRVTRLPNASAAPATEAQSRPIRTHLDEESTSALVRGDVEAALMTAVATAVARWTTADHVQLSVQRHGRPDDLVPGVDITRTVGWFSDSHPIVLPVAVHAPAADRLAAVTQRLRTIPHHGAGYGALRSPVDSPLRDLPRGDIFFNYQGRIDTMLRVGTPARIIEDPPGMLRDPNNPRTYPLGAMGALYGGRLWLAWSYPDGVYERSAIERLADDALATLRELAHSADPRPT